MRLSRQINTFALLTSRQRRRDLVDVGISSKPKMLKVRRSLVRTSRDDGNGVDLDELAPVAEHRDAE